MCDHDDQYDQVWGILNALLKHLELRPIWVEGRDEHWEIVPKLRKETR